MLIPPKQEGGDSLWFRDNLARQGRSEIPAEQSNVNQRSFSSFKVSLTGVTHCNLLMMNVCVGEAKEIFDDLRTGVINRSRSMLCLFD